MTHCGPACEGEKRGDERERGEKVISHWCAIERDFSLVWDRVVTALVWTWVPSSVIVGLKALTWRHEWAVGNGYDDWAHAC